MMMCVRNAGKLYENVEVSRRASLGRVSQQGNRLEELRKLAARLLFGVGNFFAVAQLPHYFASKGSNEASDWPDLIDLVVKPQQG